MSAALSHRRLMLAIAFAGYALTFGAFMLFDVVRLPGEDDVFARRSA